MRSSPLYIVTLALVVLTALSDLWWITIDLGSRFGLIHGGVGDFDAESFTASLTIWNDLAFYSHTLTGMLAVWMLLARHPWLLPVYAFSIIASIADLLLLSQNPLFEAGVTSLITLGGHITALVGIAWLTRAGALQPQQSE